MLKSDRSELNYAALVKTANRKVPGKGYGQGVRLALLSDVSTQHIVPLLKALFASNGFDSEIYEAGYDAIQLEAYNPGSGLYAFQPRIIVILQSIMKMKEEFYGFTGDRNDFIRAKADEIEGVWKALATRAQAFIVQSTFVIPYERPFGNFGLKLTGDLRGAVSELNREICLRVREYSGVFINDVDYLAGWVGRRHFLDEKFWALAKLLCAFEFLPDVAQNIVDIALACLGRAVKCVVLDLDNTLWGGVVGDDGLDGIGLGDLDEGGAFRNFQLYLRDLSRRGVILCVCSKNNESIARRVFQEHPDMVLKEEHIAVFVANWEDKATNIRRIREQLNIGFDSMVFLDDNPFERNLVRQVIPEIIVPELPEDPALYVRSVSELNLFETASHSAVDGQRNAFYREQEEREAGSRAFSGIDEYLQSLGTMALCERFEPRNLSRISQLIQRSNQFNLTTRRYSEPECEAMMRNESDFFPFTISLHDRFGAYGLINIVILRLNRLARMCEIDTFLMSCRVLKRGVEQFAMNKVFEFARREGCERVVGHYLPTAKNAMVEDFFAQFGFVPVSGGNGHGTEWSISVNDYVPCKVFLEEQSTPVKLSVAGGK
jgi:FkbH-like protein